ncbi:alpha-methylacyl-CoA racemase-like [Argiope bruennichi]|uniref:alpha-methylacyl-CoA racemase-like n=1 Tax=Argiope bruennichi TaxID=94029 RepID=UPI002494A552|nr:alpha-methylacyl-CoA racemase-like [Argiope bruennichi]
MALRGFKVIEFAGLAPAPFCGMVLRDNGASVIRVDKPFTMGEMDALARGKRSVVVDFKKPTSTSILSRLCAKADVLIDPFRPGVMEKFNLGPSELCKLNPKLIYARLTGFGQDGPFSKMAGHDINYIAIAGVLSALGGEKPQHPINLMGDFAGGGLICALGICLALLDRYRSGKGQVIDANMVEGSAYVSSWLWASRSKSYPYPLWSKPRGENILDGGAHFYQTYKTKDGKYIAVGALEHSFYSAFIEGLGLDPDNFSQDKFGPETQKKCADVFLTKTQAEWCEKFDLTDACVTPVVPLEEAHNHPHNAHNRSFMKQDETIVPRPAPRLSRTPAEPGLTNPVPGQHTREILLEIGFREDEIESFIEDGTVYCVDMKASL